MHNVGVEFIPNNLCLLRENLRSYFKILINVFTPQKTILWKLTYTQTSTSLSHMIIYGFEVMTLEILLLITFVRCSIFTVICLATNFPEMTFYNFITFYIFVKKIIPNKPSSPHKFVTSAHRLCKIVVH